MKMYAELQPYRKLQNYRIKSLWGNKLPYPNGEATGLAFGVARGKALPASLKIIEKEVQRTGYNTFDNGWRTLEHWEKQGVFLLNISLTVEAKKAGSHLGFWYWFAREVIKVISHQCKPVWLLWGAKAQSFKDYIGEPRIDFDATKHIEFYSKFNVILEAPHPAAETYGTSSKKFSGCDHFALCNKILELKNQKIINW